jgi:hypothetical protein
MSDNVEANKLYKQLCEKARQEDEFYISNKVHTATKVAQEYGEQYIEFSVNVSENSTVRLQTVKINVHEFCEELIKTLVASNKERREQKAVRDFLKSVETFTNQMKYLQDFEGCQDE